MGSKVNVVSCERTEGGIFRARVVAHGADGDGDGPTKAIAIAAAEVTALIAAVDAADRVRGELTDSWRTEQAAIEARRAKEKETSDGQE